MDAITKLEAIEGIRLAKARQQRGVDTKDGDLLRRVWADDAVVDCRGVMTDPVTGANSAPQTDVILHGIDEAVASAIESLAGIVSAHHVSNPEIEITSPTTGRAIWPQVDRLWFPAGAPFKEFIGYGHYHETYERIEGQWFIKRITLTRLRVDTEPA
jgi:SnoaL-like domain